MREHGSHPYRMLPMKIKEVTKLRLNNILDTIIF